MQSTEMIVEQLLKSAVLPVVAGGGLAWVGANFAPDRLKTDHSAAFGLLVGFAASMFAVVGFGEVPPVKVDGWLPYFGLGALIAMTILSKNRVTRALGHLLVMTGVFYIIYKPLTRLFSTGELALWLVGSALAWFALQLSWEDSDFDKAPAKGERILAMVVVATGVSLVSVLDGSALIGQVSGALAAASGGLFLASRFRNTLKIGPVTVGVFVTLVAALLLNAYHFVEVRPLAVGLALLSGFAINVLRLPFLSQAGLIKRSVVVCGLALMPIIVAIIFLLTGAAPTDEYDYGY